ncbi:MAG: hypothetical protein KDA79_03105 [Planctomycetaceae bacterium]|nr:hypothetical protein [Planctomycetaceae bacterium]
MVPNVDFLPASYRRQREKKLRRVWHRAVLGVFGLLILAGTLQQRRTISNREAALATLMTRTTTLRNALPDKTELDQRQVASGHRATLLALLQLEEKPTSLLSAVSTSLPEFVSLSSLRLSREKILKQAQPPQRKKTSKPSELKQPSPVEIDLARLKEQRNQTRLVIQLEGQAQDDQSIARYLKSLQQTGLFRSAQLLFTDGDRMAGMPIRRFSLVLHARLPSLPSSAAEEVLPVAPVSRESTDSAAPSTAALREERQ